MLVCQKQEMAGQVEVERSEKAAVPMLTGRRTCRLHCDCAGWGRSCDELCRSGKEEPGRSQPGSAGCAIREHSCDADHRSQTRMRYVRLGNNAKWEKRYTRHSGEEQRRQRQGAANAKVLLPSALR